jgi:predicted nucleic acid-binding protein
MLDEIRRSSEEFEIVTASPEWAEKGLQLHRLRSDKAWSWTDCISFEVLRQRRISLALSYDQHFEQAGYQALLRSEP